MDTRHLLTLLLLPLAAVGRAQDGTVDEGPAAKPIGSGDVVPDPAPAGVGPGIPVALPPDPTQSLGPRTGEAEFPTLDWRSDPTAWQHRWWLERGDWLTPPAQGSSGPRTGLAAGDAGPAPEGPDLDAAAWRALRASAADELLDVLEGERDLRVRREAVLALGRLGADSARARSVFVDALGDSRELSEVALLGLGLSGSLEGAIELASVLRDDARGRELVASTRVDARRRSTAAYALALAANRAARPELVRFAAHHLEHMLHAKERSDDLEGAVVLALGALPASSPALDTAGLVEVLLERLADRRASVASRAHVPTALARLASPSPELRERVARDLLARVAPRAREEDAVREAAVLALGLLGDADGEELDREIRSALAVVLRKGEGLERRYAAVSLGRVGARAGSPDLGAPRAARREVEALLVDHTTRARSRERVWAALALGHMGASLRKQGELLDPRSADALLEGLSKSKSAENAVGFSVASALIGDVRAREGIAERLGVLGEHEARGQLGLALGLLGHADSTPLLRRELTDSTSHPAWHGWAGLALALGGDGAVTDALVARLPELDSSIEVEASANALAWIGDSSALRTTLRRLGDERLSSDARAALARAVGWIGDEHGAPWRSPLALALNPRVAPPSLIGLSEPGTLDRLLP